MNLNITKALAIIKNTILATPNVPGIYRMLGEGEKILYIGKAKNLKNRLKQYSNFDKLSYRTKLMVSHITNIETIQTNSEIEALILELNLIKTEKPKYNILLTDDKTFPYIYFNTNHQYPAIHTTRNKNLKGKYFGPYVGAFDVHNTVDLLKKSFLIRSCTDRDFQSRTRPCLEYQIKRCSAPCVNYITKDDYSKLLSEVINFLEGKNPTIKHDLIKKMALASKNQQYEMAAILRDRIKALTTISAKQSVSDKNLDSSDVIVIDRYAQYIIIKICFFRNGLNHGYQTFSPKNSVDYSNQEVLTEFIKQFYGHHNLVKEIITNEDILEKDILTNFFKIHYGKKVTFINPKRGNKKNILDFVKQNTKLALEKKMTNLEHNRILHQKLTNIFKLQTIPNKIELFDNSHISGTHAVGAMVVVTKQGFRKDLYRKFNIKSDISKGDDYSMLREVLLRHYSKMKKNDPDNKHNSWPDLVLIDGGKGQAKIASQVFSHLNLAIPYFCIAKGKERNKGKERFCNMYNDYFYINDQEALHYLQRIRDEVHRFVITAHRTKRNKKTLTSELDLIPDIGPKRKKLLLQHFGSIAKIKAASHTDLQTVPTINENIAKSIKKYLI